MRLNCQDEKILSDEYAKAPNIFEESFFRYIETIMKHQLICLTVTKLLLLTTQIGAIRGVYPRGNQTN